MASVQHVENTVGKDDGLCKGCYARFRILAGRDFVEKGTQAGI
jgi:hypothetical protein